MKKTTKKQKAFTLVELIVVITILAILGVIAFISFEGYSSKTRNSVRTTDVASMKKTLELYSVTAGNYPAPDDGQAKDISGDNLWTQGTFDEKMLTQVGSLNKVPLDPKTKKEYQYSKAEKQNEYQIKYDLEGQTSFLNPVFAAEKNIAKISGTYNEVFVISSSGKYYSAPSLFSEGDISNHKFYITDNSEPIDFTPALLANSRPKKTDDAALATFAANLKNAYKDNDDLKNLPKYKAIIDHEDSDNAELGKLLLGGSTSGSSSVSSTPSYSCTGSLVTANATITNNTGLTSNTAYQNTNSSGKCYYECKSGYNGVNCETFNVVTKDLCKKANWFWVNENLDTMGDGYCISPRITGGNNYISWGDIGTNRNWTRSTTKSLDGSANNARGVTYDLGEYICKTLGTAKDDYDQTDGKGDSLYNRMLWLNTNKTDNNALDNISWVTVPGKPGNLSVPAIMIADCIDGKRDLFPQSANTYEKVTYNKTSVPSGRTEYNKYLLGWAKASGSHLPSAFADIGKETTDNLPKGGGGEYQIACENNLLTDANDDNDNKRIWLSAVGYTSGSNWGSHARIVGRSGCGDQDYTVTGYRDGGYSARFVVRP